MRGKSFTLVPHGYEKTILINNVIDYSGTDVLLQQEIRELELSTWLLLDINRVPLEVLFLGGLRP